MAKIASRPGTANRPGTPNPRDVTCPHLHFKYDVIDRGILSREQHLNLLSTPKGYRWVVKGSRRAQKAEEDVFVCADRRRKPGRAYVHNFLAEIWNVLTPAMIERLREMLMNEFGMSPEEAVRFICQQRTKTLEMAHRPGAERRFPDDLMEDEENGEQIDPRQPRVIIEPEPCDRNQFAIGVEPCHIREFSKIVSNKLADYVVGMMCARRDRRHRRMAEVILNSLCMVTGEKCTLEKQKNRLHKILAVTADRTALWLTNNVEDEDKMRDSKRRREDVEFRKKQKDRAKEAERRHKEKEKLRKQQEKNDKKKAKREEKENKIAKEKEELRNAERERNRKERMDASEKRKKVQKHEGRKGEGDGKKGNESGTREKVNDGKSRDKKGGGGRQGDGKGPESGGTKKEERKQGEGAKGGSSRPTSASQNQKEQKRKPAAVGGTKSASSAKKSEGGGSKQEEKKKSSGGKEMGGASDGVQDDSNVPAGGAEVDQKAADVGITEVGVTEENDDTLGGTASEEKTAPSSSEAPGEAQELGEADDELEGPTAEEAKGSTTLEVPGEEEKPGEDDVRGGTTQAEFRTSETPVVADGIQDEEVRDHEAVPVEASTPVDEGGIGVIEKTPQDVPREEETIEEQDKTPRAELAQKTIEVEAEGVVKSEVSDVDKIIAKTVSHIIETPETSTPRQEALRDIVSKELEKEVATGVKVDEETKRLVKEASSKIASWMDQKVAAVELEYGAREMRGQQRPKGPIYVLKKASRDGAIDVRVSTDSEVEQKIRSIKKISTAQTTGPSPDTPMTPDDTKMWAKWAEGASEMAEEWGKWIDRTIQDAEDRAVEFRNKAKDPHSQNASDVADWEAFSERTQVEALKWRRNRKVLQQQARVWKQKTSIE